MERPPENAPSTPCSPRKLGGVARPAAQRDFGHRLRRRCRRLGLQDTGGEKCRLTGSDAHLVEDAFANRLTVINANGHPPVDGNGRRKPSMEVSRRFRLSQTVTGEPVSARDAPPQADYGPPSVRRIDKSALSFGEPRRYRNPEHLRFVASQPCVICGRQPSDPHHVRFGQKRALGRKVSDEFTVPVCRTHHRELHRSGSEFRWWEAVGIDPLKIARKLWKKTRLTGVPARQSARTTSVDAAPNVSAVLEDPRSSRSPGQ